MSQFSISSPPDYTEIVNLKQTGKKKKFVFLADVNGMAEDQSIEMTVTAIFKDKMQDDRSLSINLGKVGDFLNGDGTTWSNTWMIQHELEENGKIKFTIKTPLAKGKKWKDEAEVTLETSGSHALEVHQLEVIRSGDFTTDVTAATMDTYGIAQSNTNIFLGDVIDKFVFTNHLGDIVDKLDDNYYTDAKLYGLVEDLGDTFESWDEFTEQYIDMLWESGGSYQENKALTVLNEIATVLTAFSSASGGGYGKPIAEAQNVVGITSNILENHLWDTNGSAPFTLDDFEANVNANKNKRYIEEIFDSLQDDGIDGALFDNMVEDYKEGMRTINDFGKNLALYNLASNIGDSEDDGTRYTTNEMFKDAQALGFSRSGNSVSKYDDNYWEHTLHFKGNSIPDDYFISITTLRHKYSNYEYVSKNWSLNTDMDDFWF